MPQLVSIATNDRAGIHTPVIHRLPDRSSASPSPLTIRIVESAASRPAMQSATRIGWIASGAIHLLAAVGLVGIVGFQRIESPSLAGTRFVVSVELAASQPAPAQEATPVEFELPPTESQAVESRQLPKAVPEVAPLSRTDVEEAHEHERLERPVVDAAGLLAQSNVRLELPKSVNRLTEQTDRSAPEDHKPRPRVAISASLPLPSSPQAVPTVVGLDEQTPARPLRNPHPVYPAEAVRRGWSGRVLLELAIGDDGNVRAVEVVESSGHSLLDESATEAVRQWRFEPARRGTRAVNSTVRLPVRFRHD